MSSDTSPKEPKLQDFWIRPEDYALYTDHIEKHKERPSWKTILHSTPVSLLLFCFFCFLMGAVLYGLEAAIGQLAYPSRLFTLGSVWSSRVRPQSSQPLRDPKGLSY